MDSSRVEFWGGNAPEIPFERAEVLQQEALSHVLGDPLRAEDYARQAFKAARVANDTRLMTESLRVLGLGLYQRGEYVVALQAFNAALELNDGLKDQTIEAELVLSIGAAHANLGHFEQAFNCYARALELFRAFNHELGLVRTMHNVGSTFRDIRRYDRAKALLTEALETMRTLQYKVGEAMCYVNLGLTANESGHFKEGLPHLERGLALALEHGDVRAECLALINLGWAKIGVGDQSGSVAHLERLQTRASEIKSRQYEGFALAGFGLVCRAQGNFDGALEHLQRALSIAQALELPRGQHMTLQALWQTCEQFRDFEGAYAHYKAYHQIEREMLSDQAQQHVHTIAANLETHLAKREATQARQRSSELEEAYSQLRRQAAQLEQYARQDALTGLSNRRHLDESVKMLFDNAKYYGSALCIIAADIDDFKIINDTFGHAIGDEVLRTIAAILREQARAGDLIARFGGEEFIMALPGLKTPDAHSVAERARTAVQNFDWTRINPNLRVTISLGVSGDLEVPNAERLISSADAQLYKAKRAGKNQVMSL
jgi:diguanylate cyclase (GGDEF)-like protein